MELFRVVRAARRPCACDVVSNHMLVSSQGHLKSVTNPSHLLTFCASVLKGGPNWIDLDHYDITAKLERVDPQRPGSIQVREALQTLLAERFQLTFHHESKEIGGYALMTAKGGFKLSPIADGGNHGASSKGGLTRQLTATQVDMGRVAAFLARETGSPVEDQTHIPGVYTFTLEWARDDFKNSSSEQAMLPSLFTAIQERLGLRLEERRVPVDLIIIDSAGRPSEN